MFLMCRVPINSLTHLLIYIFVRSTSQAVFVTTTTYHINVNCLIIMSTSVRTFSWRLEFT